MGQLQYGSPVWRFLPIPGLRLPEASGNFRRFPVDSGRFRQYPETAGGFRMFPAIDAMPNRKSGDGPYETPQITLRGKNADIVRRLADAREHGIAEASAWMIDQFINSAEGRKNLLENYGIDVSAYQKPPKVVNIRDKKQGEGA